MIHLYDLKGMLINQIPVRKIMQASLAGYYQPTHYPRGKGFVYLCRNAKGAHVSMIILVTMGLSLSFTFVLNSSRSSHFRCDFGAITLICRGSWNWFFSELVICDGLAHYKVTWRLLALTLPRRTFCGRTIIPPLSLTCADGFPWQWIISASLDAVLRIFCIKVPDEIACIPNTWCVKYIQCE